MLCVNLRLTHASNVAAAAVTTWIQTSDQEVFVLSQSWIVRRFDHYRDACLRTVLFLNHHSFYVNLVGLATKLDIFVDLKKINFMLKGEVSCKSEILAVQTL